MNKLIENSLSKAMDYNQYNLLFKQLVESERSTGEQSPEKVNYTKLNFSRTKRLDKTAKIAEEQIVNFKNNPVKQTWLVITEPWCGDAAHTLPYLNKIAQLSENIDLKIVLRDDNPLLMDEFLTNGSRSIPIVIILDETNNVLQSWGPRSKAATKLLTDYKAEHGQIDAVFKERLQLWYNKDKGVSFVNDISEAILTKK
ncbi:thioredoxin family protein [Aequorivita sp. Q41]|uniref:thioredoxin family protein n=1 Tax=Aequorivita sp. Q41 TaxID=3153300 RepID=UPI0032420AB2